MLFYMLCGAVLAAGPDVQNEFKLDTERYIPLDEVQPGMEAYCLTAYEGTKIERFELEVLSVVKNFRPDSDAILVMGKDERFIHTGPVAGCSGSPVYIDGRLGGALSFAWLLSKDPLYGVTPIEEMVRPNIDNQQSNLPSRMGFSFDYSRPIDLSKVNKQITSWGFGKKNQSGSGATLPCVLVTSGIPSSADVWISDFAESLGLAAAPSGAGSDDTTNADIELAPGGCLAVPLITGDIKAAVVGTVTDVVGDDVYGFGHGFLGYGAVDLPIATGKVHTVVSSIYRSFKFASALKIVGALRFDEATVVRGKIGAEPRMIPLSISVQRYNDPLQRTYNCQIADNQLLTPLLARIALIWASFQYGELPPEHSIKYKADIQIDGTEPLTFENISTDNDLQELVQEAIAPLALLMNNPFKTVKIDSIHFDISQDDESLASHIWSVDLSDSEVKAGEKLRVDVVVESMCSRKKKYSFEIDTPEQLKPGKYELMVLGGYEYLDFLQKAAQHRFFTEDIRSLAEALNLVLNVRRDRLYCVLMLPKGGVALDRAELPDLPATKTLVLTDPKRTLNATAYQHWVEKSVPIETVVIDGQKMEIVIER
jgi:hypothetical protein